MVQLYSRVQYSLLIMALVSGLSATTACEPIIDFSSTATTDTDTNENNGVSGPTQAVVRPKVSVDVPADPLLQMLLLSNDSTKGWQLKKRQRKGVESMQPCNQDDGLVIYASRRIDFEIGPIRCGTNDAKQTGFWQLTDRPSLLISTDGENPYEAQMLELSTNRLVISYIDEENEPVLEIYETPVAQEPIEEGPIVLTPTPAPTPSAQTSASPTEASKPTDESTEEAPNTSTVPGSGDFKTGL